MKKSVTFLAALLLLFTSRGIAQDTLLVADDYKVRTGVKLTGERCISYAPEGTKFFSGGLQLIRRIKRSRSSFETGLYLLPAIYNYHKDSVFIDNTGLKWDRSFNFDIEYYYLAIPVNYRINTRSIYLSGGIFFNHLLFRRGYFLAYTDSIPDYGHDRKFNWGWNVAAGIEKHVTRKINIFVEFKYFYTVSSFKTDGNFILNGRSLASSYTNYGVSVGANYKISKLNNQLALDD